MSEQMALPELRLLHEIGEREVHMMVRIEKPDQYSRAYYRCKCGAESDRFGSRISDETPLF